MTHASDGSSASVQACHDASQNGDTITIPAGTFTWTTGVIITHAITLQGTGVGSTIIKDNVQTPGKLIQWTLAASSLSRMTGIEFQNGGRTVVGGPPGGIIHIDGSNINGSTFRFDHSKLTNLNGSPVFDTVIGVIDHVVFDNGVSQKEAFAVYAQHWNGAVDGDDTSWADPTNFGSSQFLFVEDCTFSLGTSDAFAGARFVIRHCTVRDDGIIYTHGTESTGRTRGARAQEVYNNTLAGTGANRFVGTIRSGTVLFHDNTITGYWGNMGSFTLSNYRDVDPFNPWGGADGTNVWDVNGPIAFTGTAASNSANSIVTVSGANWTTNQWAKYTIRRPTNIGTLGGNTFSCIVSNTANTITYQGSVFGNVLKFTAGDTVEIRKVTHALDQPGRARGSQITQNPPVVPAGWNNQITEPCYSWNNIATDASPPAHINFVGDSQILANVHYFNDTPMPGYTPFSYPHPLTQTEMITLTGNTATAETITLTWTGALGTTVDIYRDGALFAGAVPNNGTYVTTETGGGIGVSHVWEVRGNTASNDVTLV